jgi:hypothetical protein
MKHICGKKFHEKFEERKKKFKIERIQKIKNKITRTKIQKKKRQKKKDSKEN